MASVVYHQYVPAGGKPPPPSKESKEEQQRKARKEALDGDFTFERTRAVITKRQQSEMLLAKARNELIAKDLVERQAAYLLIAMRQKMLSAPTTYARRILGLTDVREAAKILREIMISVLNEIKDLPQKVVDPNWLDELDEKDGGLMR